MIRFMGHALRLRRVLIGLSCLFPGIASAHEAYVLPKEFFWKQMSMPFSSHAFDALQNANDLHITVKITAGILILLTLNFLFQRTKAGLRFRSFLERFAFYGPLFVRWTIAVALFYSAWTWSFLGPELELQSMPFPMLLRAGLFACSAFFALGLFTEIAAIVCTCIFLLGFFVFGPYVLTYLNYLGELIVLMLFGMRHWSVDARLFGPLKRWKKWEKYETSIVRALYGFALIYAGVTVKFLHPDLTEYVAVHWNLAQFHWLFPSDPLLITMGAGLSEVAIGLFILLGFELRLMVFISLFYITLSLLYFRELVWPHLMLYGISFNLLLQPEVFTVDHLIFTKHLKKHRWWHRPFLPHGKGKGELAKVVVGKNSKKKN